MLVLSGWLEAIFGSKCAETAARLLFLQKQRRREHMQDALCLVSPICQLLRTFRNIETLPILQGLQNPGFLVDSWAPY